MEPSPDTRFVDILEGIPTAMFVTIDSDGFPHARPLAVARVDREGVVWFVTHSETTKIAEISRAPLVGLTFQDHTRHASASGRVELVRDPELVREMWSESWRLWFPDGPDTPELVLVKVVISHGEYWDNSGFRGIAFLFDAARSYLTGKKADQRDNDRDRQAKVEFGG